MNQHVHPARLSDHAETTANSVGGFKPVLRMIAAQLRQHHACVHRLANPAGLLDDAIILSADRAPPAGLLLRDVCPAPVLEAMSAHARPLSWSRASSWMDDGADKAAWRAKRMHGLSVAFHDARGTHIALTLSDTAPNNGVKSLETLSALAAQFLPALSQVDSSRFDQQLSERERDCIQWAAAGKTVHETAMILDLSIHTVAQHLANAAIKLGAVNKVQAVAKAVRAGLVNLAAI
jgi:DNA-binding CsgD family transcriptional regulator